jgi:hypothetical protein
MGNSIGMGMNPLLLKRMGLERGTRMGNFIGMGMNPQLFERMGLDFGTKMINLIGMETNLHTSVLVGFKLCGEKMN